MTAADGLAELPDGSGVRTDAAPALAPLSADSLPSPKRLWVVANDELLHADEECPFGAERVAGRIKHTNLTGGEPAFSGGEVIFIGGDTLIVSGDSGRYGPRTAKEMQDVANAFRESGYTVYSTGNDHEANRALPLIGPEPQLI